MDKHQVLETLKLAREHSKKRNFAQSVDIILNFNGLNLKKPEDNINTFIELPYSKGKVSKIGALVGNELSTKAKETCDLVILKDDFYSYGTDQKKTKKIAKDIDFFIAQANLMTEVAKAFGKVLGPMGKMPNPKAGAVVPPIIPSLKPIVDKLKNSIKLQTKNELAVKGIIGNESMKDDELAENALAVYKHVLHLVHDDKSKIVKAILKLSMGRPFVVTRKYTEEELSKKEIKSKKKPKQKKDSEEKKTE